MTSLEHTMTWVDKFIQSWRIRKVLPFIKPGARVLDIGSVDGALFKQAPQLKMTYVGIDPTVPTKITEERCTIYPGFFPKDLPETEPFQCITMLAVLEHFPNAEHTVLAEGCARFLKPGGLVLITVPSPAVDTVLKWLMAFRLIDGMSLEEHHGYDVNDTPRIFSQPSFKLEHRSTFQFGLNNLFVFRRTE